MLTANDIAADLKVSVDTARDYLRTGKVPGFQIVENGPWRVDDDVYAAWKAERSAPADPHRLEPRSSRSRARRAS